MIAASITISFGGSILILSLAALLLILLAIVFYRYTLPPLPPRRRVVLSCLRALALILLMASIFEPVLRLVENDDQPPVVAVLIDDSQSMALQDAAGDRASATRRLLRDQPFARSVSGEIQYIPFASTLYQPFTSSPAESLTFTGQITNLSEALSKLKERIPKENIQAAILISDGNYTEGKNPLYEAEQMGIPIYTIGVGDTSDQKDILVEQMTTNSIAYAETSVPVDVTIKSSGYNGETVEVTLLEGERLVGRSSLTLRGGTVEYPVRFSAEMKDEGTKKLTVKVSHLSGELTERNNSRSVFVKVLKNKLKILIIAGAPSPDVAAVRQGLAEDQALQLNVLVQKDASGFYEGQFSNAAIDSADCVVLIGFPGRSSSADIVRQVVSAIDQQKKPLLYIHGRTVDYSKLQSLEPVLPIRWSGATQDEVLVSPSVAEKQRSHSLVQLEGAIRAGDWQQLPPLFKTHTVFQAKPEAEVLVWAKVQNVVLTEPLIAIRNLNRSKSLALTGHGLWRWRLLTQSNTNTENFLPLLLSNAIHWLTTAEDQKNVRIAPIKDAFTTAEPVRFTGQVYDDQLRPVDNADVTVELQRNNEKMHVALSPVGNGRYEGALDRAEEGDYTFTGKATGEGKTFGQDRGRLSVGLVNIEFLETKMNKQLLEQLASKSGGSFATVSAAGEIADRISENVPLAPRELIRASEIELWNWRYLAGLIVLLFGVEWFLRRRSGML